VVACVECTFSHDAHGIDADDAIKAVAPTHAEGKHKMVARAVDYSAHPLYERRGG